MKKRIGSSIKCSRVFKAVFICMAIMVSAPNVVYGQLTSKQEKQLEKERNKVYKEKKKELEKEGWKIAGSTKTLSVALLEHYAKLDGENKYELVGEVSQCRSINVCKQFAISNAQNTYASMASAEIKGRVANMMLADASFPAEEMDKMIAAYEKKVSANIGGALTQSFAIVKDNGDRTKEYKLFFIVDENKARMARKIAMQKSLEEVKIVAEIGEQVSSFIESGEFVEQ